jgi:hypothetical protein
MIFSYQRVRALSDAIIITVMIGAGGNAFAIIT